MNAGLIRSEIHITLEFSVVMAELTDAENFLNPGHADSGEAHPGGRLRSLDVDSFWRCSGFWIHVCLEF